MDAKYSALACFTLFTLVPYALAQDAPAAPLPAPQLLPLPQVQEPSALSLAPPVPAPRPTRFESVPPFSKLQLKLDGPFGTSIRFGTVTQVQYEALGSFSEHDAAQNFFLRRTMLLLGGTILHDLEYFIARAEAHGE